MLLWMLTRVDAKGSARPLMYTGPEPIGGVERHTSVCAKRAKDMNMLRFEGHSFMS